MYPLLILMIRPQALVRQQWLFRSRDDECQGSAWGMVGVPMATIREADSINVLHLDNQPSDSHVSLFTCLYPFLSQPRATCRRVFTKNSLQNSSLDLVKKSNQTKGPVHSSVVSKVMSLPNRDIRTTDGNLLTAPSVYQPAVSSNCCHKNPHHKYNTVGPNSIRYKPA